MSDTDFCFGRRKSGGGGGGTTSSNKDTFVVVGADKSIFNLSWTPLSPDKVLVEVNGIGWLPSRYGIVGDVLTLDTALVEGEYLIVKG